MTNLRAWWNGLTDEQRDRLMDDPDGTVPLDLVAQPDAPPVAAAWWPETQPGPAGFSFGTETEIFIETRALARKVVRLEAERRELHERHFPIVKECPVVYGESLEPDTLDRLDALDERIAEVRHEYRTFIIDMRA